MADSRGAGLSQAEKASVQTLLRKSASAVTKAFLWADWHYLVESFARKALPRKEERGKCLQFPCYERRTRQNYT